MIKKITLGITLLFSTLMFASPAYANDWESVSYNVVSTIYVDFDGIRKVDGYVYYWALIDYLKPLETGDFSVKVYRQGDCKLYRDKLLSGITYKQSMGEGSGSPYVPNPEWIYPDSNSSGEEILKQVCRRAGL